MASLLRDSGLNTRVGDCSVRIDDCPHFSFQEYGGDLGEPQIEADAESLQELMQQARIVSDVLGRAAIRHRFEVYDGRSRELVGYLHFDWPLDA